MPTRGRLSLDHVFVAVSRDGPEVEPLRAAGFTEGAPNVHRGQGTACRRFFFENAYLEFAWLENPAQKDSCCRRGSEAATPRTLQLDRCHIGGSAVERDRGDQSRLLRDAGLPS